MVSKEEKLIKNTMLFSVGNLGSKVLVLLIVPFYTYFVSIEQMGQYDVLNTYVGLFAPLACLTVYEGIYRWLLERDSNKNEIIKTGVSVIFLIMILFDALAFLFFSFWKFEYSIDFILLIDATVIYTTTQFLTRGLRNNKVYALQGVIYSISLVLSNIVFVILLRYQARGLILSMIIAYLLSTLYMILSQRLTSYFFRGNKSNLLAGKLLMYSVPMVPNNIAWWLVAASNRIVINLSLGLSANGVFAIAMKFPTVVNLLSTFFYQAWQEQAITEYDSKERDEYYSKVFNSYSKILLSGILVLLPITKVVIVFFMEKAYVSAQNYVGILYLSSVFSALAGFYGTGYLSSRKTMGALYTTGIGAAVNVALCFILVTPLKIVGVAIASLCGNLIIMFSRVIQTKQFFHIKINIKEFFLLIVIYTAGNILLFKCESLMSMILCQVMYGAIFIYTNRAFFESIFSFIFKKKK